MPGIWHDTVEYIRSHFEISDAAVDMWIRDLQLASLDSEGHATVHVNTNFQVTVLEQQYAQKIQKALSEVVGFPVQLSLASTEYRRKIDPAPADDHFDSSFFFNRQAETGEYTFENFIVGASNRFAHAAAYSVAKNPSGQYNPLFIYGGSGLGKTHLLFAICAEVRYRHPEMRVLYTKCDEMTNEFIQSLRDQTVNEFNERYRQADILLVDDIQFLAGKTQTQVAFFHTFDYLHSAGKQIVLTSDRPPKEIATLEDRLRGRFEMGLLADVEPPDFETRVAIIKRKAYLLEMEIPDDVCEYIASQLKSNVRQLEGAVNALHAQYMMAGNPPTISVAQGAIRDIRSRNQPTPVTIERIQQEVARTFNVSPQELCSKTRTAPISRARQVAFYVTRSVTGLKQEEIGKEFGGFDHSTVLYALRKVDTMMQRDPTFKNTVNDIIKNLSDE